MIATDSPHRIGRKDHGRSAEGTSMLLKKGVCRGASPLCRELEGAPHIRIFSSFLLKKWAAIWPKGFIRNLLAPPDGRIILSYAAKVTGRSM